MEKMLVYMSEKMGVSDVVQASRKGMEHEAASSMYESVANIAAEIRTAADFIDAKIFDYDVYKKLNRTAITPLTNFAGNRYSLVDFDRKMMEFYEDYRISGDPMISYGLKRKLDLT